MQCNFAKMTSRGWSILFCTRHWKPFKWDFLNLQTNTTRIQKEPPAFLWIKSSRVFLLSVITIWNSLWLSCSKNGRHMKDGDHIFFFCSVSWGSERNTSSVSTGRLIVSYLLHCLPLNCVFLHLLRCYHFTAAYQRREINIFLNIHERKLCQFEKANQ